MSFPIRGPRQLLKLYIWYCHFSQSMMIQSNMLIVLLISNRVLQLYPMENNMISVRFNPTGDRLLCLQGISKSHFVHDLEDLDLENVELKKHYRAKRNGKEGHSAYFAGISTDQRDDLVAIGSDRGILIYSVPKGPFEDQLEIDKPLHSLTSRPRGYRHVRYNPKIGALVSYGVNDRINFDPIMNEEPS